MLRAIGALLFAVIFLILSIPIMGIEWLLSKTNRKAADTQSLHLIQWVFKTIIAICGTEVIVKGEENVPTDEPVLYVANHRSIFDVVICYSRVPDLTGFIAKDNLKSVPLLNVWMERLHCYFLDRSNARDGLRVVLSSIEDIKQGISIFVFPEGTRTKTGKMAAFKEGTFKIATKSGCPIIPVAISNTEQILRAHMPFVKQVKVIIHYGKPIYPDKFNAEEKKHLGAYSNGVIADMLSEDEGLY